ncbi:AAA family ATPase [Ferrimonas pelagia]|uniref:SPOR domain-containing protein n=1 Tax=Ferrimonas pelagia TaxID=1177826 RepID=A0ABP9FEQ4_9GAMM
MSEPAAASTLLPSQRSLLERLRYLTEYGDHLILLHGARGMGKTVLAQAVLEHSGEFNQAFLTATAAGDPARLREQLIHQLIPHAVFDSLEPLPDTLERLAPEIPGRLLLVIDNAHWVADTLLAELLTLVMDSEAVTLHVTLILVCEDGLVGRLQAELPESFSARLLPVEIGALPLRERQRLYEQLALQGGKQGVANDEALERQLRQSDGSASAVVGLVEQLREARPLAAISPAHRGGIAALSVLVLALMIWLWLEPAAEPEAWDLASDVAEGPVSADDEIVPLAFVSSIALEGVPESDPDDRQEEWALDGAALDLAGSWPPEAVASDLAGSWPPEAVASDLPLAGEIQAEVALPEAEIDLSVPPVEVAVAPVTEISVPLSQQPLLQRPADSYVLQLAVFSYPKLIAGFMASHGIDDDVTVYRIDRQPQPWYVLVLGGFEDRQAAAAALAQMPEGIQSLSPYIKSMAAVQKELSEEQLLAEILRQQG